MKTKKKRVSKNKINVKVGDCFFFHYVLKAKLKAYIPEYRDKITEEERLWDTFGFFDHEGNLWSYFEDDDEWHLLHGYGKGWELNDISEFNKELNKPGGSLTEVLCPTEIYWMDGRDE